MDENRELLKDVAASARAIAKSLAVIEDYLVTLQKRMTVSPQLAERIRAQTNAPGHLTAEINARDGVNAFDELATAKNANFHYWIAGRPIRDGDTYGIVAAQPKTPDPTPEPEPHADSTPRDLRSVDLGRG